MYVHLYILLYIGCGRLSRLFKTCPEFLFEFFAIAITGCVLLIWLLKKFLRSDKFYVQSLFSDILYGSFVAVVAGNVASKSAQENVVVSEATFPFAQQQYFLFDFFFRLCKLFKILT